MGHPTRSISNERPNQHFNTWLKTSRARELRRDSTDAERALWRRLRGNALGVKFRRQHPFEGYVLDFVCLEASLVVELDGGQHAQCTSADASRTARLEAAGFRVLRFWNNQALEQTDAVLAQIAACLAPRPLGLLQEYATMHFAQDFEISDEELLATPADRMQP